MLPVVFLIVTAFVSTALCLASHTDNPRCFEKNVHRRCKKHDAKKPDPISLVIHAQTKVGSDTQQIKPDTETNEKNPIDQRAELSDRILAEQHAQRDKKQAVNNGGDGKIFHTISIASSA